MSIPIATSIAPYNIEIQQRAVASWEKLGFSVISVNAEDEIAVVRDAFPTVRFVAVARNASRKNRAYVCFDDILAALLETGSRVFGIVNSDVFLVADDDFGAFIGREAAESVVFGSRVDLDALDSPEGDLFVVGFDYFFFNRQAAGFFPQTEFCLGIPWWDYWVPIVPLMKGYPVRQLLTPVAFHLRHPSRYQYRYYISYADKMYGYLVRQSAIAGSDSELVHILGEFGKRPNSSSLAFTLLGYIVRKADKLIYRNVEKDAASQEISFEEYISMKYELDYYRRYVVVLHKYYAEIIRRILASRTWRIAAPLRWVRNKLMRWPVPMTSIERHA